MSNVDPRERPPNWPRNVPHDRREVVERRLRAGRRAHRDEASTENRAVTRGDDLGRAAGRVGVAGARLDADALEGRSNLRGVHTFSRRHRGSVVVGGDAPAGEDVREQVDERGGRLAVGVRIEPAAVGRRVDSSDRIGNGVFEPAADALGGEVERTADANPAGVRVFGGVLADAAVIEDLLPRVRIHAIAVSPGEGFRRGFHSWCNHVNEFDPIRPIFSADIRGSNYISKSGFPTSNQQPI